MVKNGTQSWPGIAWSDQTNTGIYRNTGAIDTYNISFAIGNTTPMTINTTGVGIGTANPISTFNIAGLHTTTPMVLSGNVPSLYFHDTEQGIETETAGADNRYDSWMVYADGGSLYFGRKDNMDSNTSGFDSIDMRIDHTGTLHANMGDINLSNEKSEKPNEVDGTRGSWTIQEGDENLFVINRNTGKKYKMLLGEVE